MASTLSTSTTITSTALQTLANSATAGWGSASIDNSTTAYDTALLQAVFDPANTAAANSKGFFVFVWGCDNTSDYPTTGAASGGTTGTQGALTFLDVTTTPCPLKLGEFVPYVTADGVVRSSIIDVARCLGTTRLPAYWGVAVVNHSGAALTSATLKYRGVTY